MQFRKLLLTGISCLLLLTSLAQQGGNPGTITGSVKDENGQSVPSATLQLGNTNKGAATGADGNFTIENVTPGKYTLKISALGFTSFIKQIEVKDGQRVVLNLSMKSGNRDISEVTVLGRTATQEVKQQAYNVIAVDAKKLHNSTLDLSHALDRVSGVRVREAGGVGSRMDFSLNGFNGRQVKFFLDGIPMDNFGSSFQLNNVPINLAERIEVYKGVVPIWLGSDALGGAINIVTGTSQRSYLDASYSYGSFNTHRTAINAGYTSKSGFTVQLNAFQNYSDNNYWMNVDVADINTGAYYPNQRVRRFHDNYHNETVIANVGVVGKKYADRLLIGITLGQNKADIQTGARQVSVFGKWYRRGNIVMPTLKYQVKDLFTKGLDFNFNANYNLGEEQNIDTVFRRYNWFQQYKEYAGAGAERERQLYKYKNNNGIVTAGFSYRINDQHSFILNNVLNTFNRKGYDELFPGNDKYNQPRITNKNVLGVGYKFDYNTRWSTSVFGKYFYQKTKYSITYTPEGSNATAYLPVQNEFNKIGYGFASTYFVKKNLQLKGSYEKSYRLPSTDELFGDLLNIEGNVGLLPESSDNFNIGFSYQTQINKDHRFSIDANYMYRLAVDFIRPSLNPNQTKQTNGNLADVTNGGIDGEIRYSFKKLFTAGVTATYQNLRNNTRFEENQTYVSPVYRDRIPNMPYFFGNADASVFLKDVGHKGNTLTLGYNLLFVNPFYLSWPSQGTASTKYKTDRQLAHDANIVYTLSDGKYNIALECKNLTDANLFDNFALQKPGRAFYVKLRYFISKSAKQ
jgi:outer membrane cobalamin receptor